jgi:two-component system NtrC family sensor kinase
VTRKPSLRAELLFNLAFLAGAALILGVGTVLAVGAIAPGLEPARLTGIVIVIVLADLAVFILFGRYIVNRHVLRPVGRLIAAADAVAAGRLDTRAPGAETQDLQILSERLNRMTDHLLDAQGEVVRAEKLASVGRLAAGIAHEVGNPLGAAGTYLDVLQRRGADQEVVAGMRRELERIDRIVRSLLDYARPREDSVQAIDIRGIANGAFDLLQQQGALKGVQARLELAADVPRVMGRAHVLEQVIVNLMLNAAHAAAGGDVVLGARRWLFDAEQTPRRRQTDPGLSAFPRVFARRPSRLDFATGHPGALLYVADSGPGVAPEDRDAVFEPFYTTKAPGEGTGLGLAIVAREIHEMGGVVWVDGAREGGAAFKVFLPEALP